VECEGLSILHGFRVIARFGKSHWVSVLIAVHADFKSVLSIIALVLLLHVLEGKLIQHSDIKDLYKCGKSSVARDTATNVCVLPIQVREKLGNTMSVRTYNMQRKGLCPPQSRAIQRQTSEVGALQYKTIYELIEQSVRQPQEADVGSALYHT